MGTVLILCLLSFCAAGIAVSFVVACNILYTAKIMNRWSSARTEEMIITLSIMTALLMIVWWLLDTTL